MADFPLFNPDKVRTSNAIIIAGIIKRLLYSMAKYCMIEN